MQQNKPRSNPRRDDLAKNLPVRHFFGTTTIIFVMGNSKKQEGTSAKSKNKKVAQPNGETYL